MIIRNEEYATTASADAEIPEAEQRMAMKRSTSKRGKRRVSEVIVRPHLLVRPTLPSQNLDASEEEHARSNLLRSGGSLPALLHSNSFKRNKSNDGFRNHNVTFQNQSSFGFLNSTSRPSLSRSNASFGRHNSYSYNRPSMRNEMFNIPQQQGMGNGNIPFANQTYESSTPQVGSMFASHFQRSASVLANSAGMAEQQLNAFLSQPQLAINPQSGSHVNPLLNSVLGVISEESKNGPPRTLDASKIEEKKEEKLVVKIKAHSSPSLKNARVELEKKTKKEATICNQKIFDETSQESSASTRIKFDPESHPQTTLVQLLQEAGYRATPRKAADMTDFFVQFTEEHIAAYDKEIVGALRSRNIPLLRELHKKGKLLHCANRFGESLVHMACRRGFIEVLRFLVEEGGVSLRVKDDFGRTPLHDACWHAEPNLEMMDYLITHEPDLLLVQDTRGHFPFTYARKNHWKQWNSFLLERKDKLRLKTFLEPIVSDDENSEVIG